MVLMFIAYMISKYHNISNEQDAIVGAVMIDFTGIISTAIIVYRYFIS